MSTLGNLAGYQPGIRAAQLLGYRFRTRPLTDPHSTPVGGPVSDPPHVRAIASRPDPTRPIQTTPDRGAISIFTKKEKNGQNHFSAVGEVACASAYGRTREAVGSFEWCWACRQYIGLDVDCCPVCTAPPWAGWVRSTACDGPGVYVLAAECGLWKVGVSSKSVTERTTTIISKATRAGASVAVIGCLPLAKDRVERWLHEQLRDSCDRSWAVAERLPNPTEWFWPTPALRALLANESIVDALEPEFWAPPEVSL